MPCPPGEGTLTTAARAITELTLEELLSRLERKHDAEPDRAVRARIWKLINDAGEYLLARDDQRRTG